MKWRIAYFSKDVKSCEVFVDDEQIQEVLNDMRSKFAVTCIEPWPSMIKTKDEN